MNGIWTEFRHTLRRLRGQIVGWGLGLALYGLLMGLIYDTIQNIPGLEDMLASYPPALMAFFGGSFGLATPSGYFGVYYASYMPLIVGIFAVSAAAGLLAGDEERGTLDLTLAQPVSRSGLFWGRWLGLLVALALVLVIGWAGWAVTLPFSTFEVSAAALLLAFAPLWALVTVFAALAVLLSLVLPSARLAATTAGGLLVANWLLDGLANLNETLRGVIDLTPWALFQGGDAVVAVQWGWVAALAGIGLLLAVAAWALFLRRDIRVGGERGWGAGFLTQGRGDLTQGR